MTSFPFSDPIGTIHSQVTLLIALSRPDAFTVLEKLGCSHFGLRSLDGTRLRLAAFVDDRVLRLHDVSDDEDYVGSLGFDQQVDNDELTIVLDWPGTIYDANGDPV